jgi:rod shape-determining protein MreD
MRRAVLCTLAVATVLLQVMFVDRLALPGSGVPDVALVLVVVLGLTRGPVTGMLTGFVAGLGLDLAPPGGYLIGESALIFCVIGYGCGRLSGRTDGSVPRQLAAAVIAVGAGEAAQAAGALIASALIAGDAGLTLTAALRGLPVAVLYDVVLCAVLLSVTALTGRRSLASQPGRRALRPAAMAGAGAVRIGEPLRGLHHPYAPRTYAGRAYGGRSYVGRLEGGGANRTRLDRRGVDGVRLGRSPADGFRPDRGGVVGFRAGRGGAGGYRAGRGGADGLRAGPGRLALARAGRSKPPPATASLARLPARQPAAGSPLRAILPRSLFRRQPRMCRQVPRWTGARSARYRGVLRRSGGLR